MATPALALLALLLLAPPAPAPDDGGPPPAPPAPAAPPGERTAAVEAPAPAPEADPWVAVTTGDDIRVRAGPSVNFRVLERLPKGSWMVVTGMAGEFARVRIPGGVPVFVSADLCEAAADGKTAVVRRSDVLLRPTPGQEYFPLEGQKLQEGDSLAVLETAEGEGGGKWLKVLPPDRIEYFVHASLLERVAAEGERAEELARITLERRDGYTGGKEAEAARAAEKAREDGFAALVEAAVASLAKAPAATLPPDAAARQADLQQVMTESGSPATRGRASRVSRDYLVREKEMLVAKAKAESSAVAADLERKLAAVEERYRAAMAELLKASPRAAAPKHLAVGTIRRSRSGGYELVKAGVVLHEVESLRYDLSEFLDLRVGVNGKRIAVDASKGEEILRIDALEILE